MGAVGGLLPSPLHLIALTQIALGRRLKAAWVLVAPPVAVDAVFLVVTYFFFQIIPPSIAHYTAYAGGVALMGFGVCLLWKHPRKNPEKSEHSWNLTYSSLTLATVVEVTAPGTWVYWLTIAGPIIAEGRLEGYWRIMPFFVGSLVGYYGAAFLSVWLMAWGAGAHKHFRRYLFVVANSLLIILGAVYLARAYFVG